MLSIWIARPDSWTNRSNMPDRHRAAIAALPKTHFGPGLALLGRLVEFLPYPVTTGFTSGIAVFIATRQLKDFLGLSIVRMPDHFTEKVREIVAALPTLQAADVAIGLLTLTVLVAFPRL